MSRKNLKTDDLKNIKTDDLMDVMQDEKVMALLVERLTPVVEAAFKKLLTEFKSTLHELVESLVTDQVNKELEPTISRMNVLESDNKLLQRKIDDLEVHSRLNNLVFHGIEDSYEDTTHQSPYSSIASSRRLSRPTNRQNVNLILDFCQTRLDLKLSEYDISTAHRLPTKGKDHTQPLIVNFISRNVRDSVLASRKMLRQKSDSNDPTKFFINEHLTRGNAQIFAQARKLVKDKTISSTWTKGGFTYIKKSEDLNDKPRKLLNLKDLDPFLVSHPASSPP